MIRPWHSLRASPRFAAETRSGNTGVRGRTPDSVRRRHLPSRLIRGIGVCGLVALVAVAPLGCSDDDDDEFTGPSSAPASHTVSKDGVRHLPGLDDPETNCVACHGADLRGGAGAPSCFTCHGKKWP